MLPGMVYRLTSPLARRVTTTLVERLWPHLLRFFEQYPETHGRSALRYRDVRLDGVTGALRSLYWLTRATSKGGNEVSDAPFAPPPAAEA